MPNIPFSWSSDPRIQVLMKPLIPGKGTTGYGQDFGTGFVSPFSMPSEGGGDEGGGPPGVPIGGDPRDPGGHQPPDAGGGGPGGDPFGGGGSSIGVDPGAGAGDPGAGPGSQGQGTNQARRLDPRMMMLMRLLMS